MTMSSSTAEKSPLLDSAPPSSVEDVSDNEYESEIDHERCVNGDRPIREDGTSNFGTIMHIIKGNLGTGILAMPYAFSNAGILVGTVGLLIIGIICVHCMHLLVNCSHKLCAKLNRASMDYADVAEESFNLAHPKVARHSNTARNAVNTFLFITQVGFCCAYVLFIAQNVKLCIQKLAGDNSNDKSTYKPDFPMNTQLFELCLLVLLIPFVFIKNMKHLAPFSFFANVATLGGLLLIFYYILFYKELNSVSRLPLFTSMSQLPIYLGTAIYAFEGIGVILPVENTMREPKALPSLFGVLNMAMTIVCVLYITVGFYGYIEFGEYAQGSVTLNICAWYGVVVQILFSLAIFVSYGIQFYVPMSFIGPRLRETRLAEIMGPTVLDSLFRVGLVIITFAVAAIVDEYLGLLISLIGSMASSALALIFPAIFDIITFWGERHSRRYYWVSFIKNILIAVFGFCCFLFGTVFSLWQLIEKISHHTEEHTTNSCGD